MSLCCELRYLVEREYGKAVDEFLDGKSVPQHVYDAMVSAVFNMGPGSLNWAWAKAIKAGLSMHASGGGTVDYLLDTSGIESTNYSANRVVLWKFKDSAGTDRFLVYDADAATSVLVDTNETE